MTARDASLFSLTAPPLNFVGLELAMARVPPRTGWRTISGMKRTLSIVFSLFYFPFSVLRRRAPCASTTTTAATPTMSGSASTAPCSNRWSGREIPPKRSTRANWAIICLRCARSGSGKLLYSRGFSSVFAEWKTTDEAQHANRTFSESLRFPESRDGGRSVAQRAHAARAFTEVWKTAVDPKDKFVDRSRPAFPGRVDYVAEDGRSGEKGRLAGSGRWLHRGRARQV